MKRWVLTGRDYEVRSAESRKNNGRYFRRKGEEKEKGVMKIRGVLRPPDHVGSSCSKTSWTVVDRLKEVFGGGGGRDMSRGDKGKRKSPEPWLFQKANLERKCRGTL